MRQIGCAVESAADFLGGDQARKLALVSRIKQELAGIHFASPNRQPVRIKPLSTTLWYMTGYLGLAANEVQKDEPALVGKLVALRNSITRWRVEIERDPARSARQLTRNQQAFFKALRSTFQAIKSQDTCSPMRAQETINQRVYERAQSVLSPDQMLAFGRFQTNQLQMLRLGMSMARKFFAPEAGENGVGTRNSAGNLRGANECGQ